MNCRNQFISTTVLLIAVSFGLHLIWENLQAPLYAGYDYFGQHFLVCLWGTVGDVLITLFVFALISLFLSNWRWILKINVHQIFVLAAIGFLIALAIEWRALLQGRWAYSEMMPLLPYFEVGLLPVLQMTILLPLTFYISSLLLKFKTRR